MIFVISIKLFLTQKVANIISLFLTTKQKPMKETEAHLVGHEIRPRFKVETTERIQDLVTKIDAKLKEENAVCHGHVYPGYAKLYIPIAQQHYWSPQLTVTFEEVDGKTVLRGMYGPRPAVWTMFIFFYALIAFLILVVGIVGLSYWSLGKSMTILWFVPALFILFFSLYFVAYSGQKLGKDEIMTLHHFLENSTGLKI